ncbi:hypothetical protein C5167_039728 [Papaver somniferum]|uniref:Protein kinase domain-containing protein n=1 Tax=Papaver somniferum TaxID=3469 RepID=A0A4Y7IH75_PAPSO|nr:hypothetical protein C5167_039728 [Papaver somniferum]
MNSQFPEQPESQGGVIAKKEKLLTLDGEGRSGRVYSKAYLESTDQVIAVKQLDRDGL